MDRKQAIFESIDSRLQTAYKSQSFEDSLEIAKEIVKIFDINKPKAKQVRFNKLNSSWVFKAPDFEDRLASYEIAQKNEKNLDFKLYWAKKVTKQIIGNLIALTPNFEDGIAHRRKNIGIDFVVPKSADSLIICLSNNYVIRTLQLRKKLSNTDKIILEKWIEGFDLDDLENKEKNHKILWESFDISPVNKEFYKDISSFFNELVQHLEDQNIFSNQRYASTFTNRLIGRIIFCHFLDHKNLLNKDYQYFEVPKGNSTEYYMDKLQKLFFRVLSVPLDKRDLSDDQKTPFLNGGLFEEFGDDKEFHKSISFPKDYFDRFYQFLNRFNFTTDESTPDYQQVAIDPEMLGRIFENLLAEQVEETGQQARKAKGAFYTPREIVNYMCKESLRHYLLQNIDSPRKDEIIENLLDKKEHEFTKSSSGISKLLSPIRPRLIEILDSLKVIDPACGSGAFPMGMMQLLLEVYERVDNRFDSKKTKLSIIKNNLYGVDIEPLAIEIARLRAWLSILVDEDENVEPLPNLDFKFICANTLIALNDHEAPAGNGMKPASSDQKIKHTDMFDDGSLEEDISNIRDAYYEETSYDKKMEYRAQYEQYIKDKIKEANGNGSKRKEQLLSYNPFDVNSVTKFFDPKFMFGVDKGFDIVVGNPPYVSTKGRNDLTKKILKANYGFVDDLYSHFIFKGFSLLKDDLGVLSFITSKTFWTIQSKKNLRDLLLSKKLIELYDTASPFSAMVDTCIVTAQNKTIEECYDMSFKDGKRDLLIPKNYSVSSDIYQNSVNNVFFEPSEFNLQVYDKYNNAIKKLMDEWWDKIKTSKDIAKNAEELGVYRSSLNPGDITLLGLITEGGQGLATANNGKFIGVGFDTREALKIKKSRPKKLFEAITKENIKELKNIKNQSDAVDFLNKKSEEEIARLFDELKERYGRDIFGQGYLYKIIDKNQIANVDQLSDTEKLKGINEKRCYVPYDKGDKGGNRWFLQTPFYIDWSKESVEFLNSNSGKSGKGMPVVRNPQFYFREGVCWTDVNSTYLKSRLKSKGVYDVLSMSIFSKTHVPDWFFVFLINSKFISEYVSIFVNTTSHFQINDARQIPIVIPSKDQLVEFSGIFNKAVDIKRKQFAEKITKSEAIEELSIIQEKVDMAVLNLYLR